MKPDDHLSVTKAQFDAVRAAGDEDLADFHKRLVALVTFAQTPEYQDLLAMSKRINKALIAAKKNQPDGNQQE